ncbi:MAG: PIG-L family deacetylase [Planctomycetota bacterium]
MTFASIASVTPAQSWRETCGRSSSGVLALHQAARDAAADSLVLLVASHPDDRYILPSVWLRSTCGYRVAVLLATRGGGGQNSMGPETGDAFERIRTLETEAGCRLSGAEAWYLNRPDGGYRRSAEETFAEWGRDGTLRDLVRLLRQIRPDAVLTTHNDEEAHGHDLALVELLPEAVRLADDPAFDAPGAPHRIGLLMFGAGTTPSPNAIAIDADRLHPDLGQSFRLAAYDILRGTHVSPGPPAGLDAVFEPVLRFEASPPRPVVGSGSRALSLPSLLDADRWPGDPGRAEQLDAFLREQLPLLVDRPDPPVDAIVEVLGELRQHRAAAPADAADLGARLDRRIEALERLLLGLARLQVEVDLAPGTVGVAGEEFTCAVHLLSGRPRTEQDPLPALRAEGLDGVGVQLAPLGPAEAPASSVHYQARIRIPLREPIVADPMTERFTADRFVPPVQVRFHLQVFGVQVPVVVTVPVAQQSPVELTVWPRMLLLPSARSTVQFSVEVVRNSQFPIEGDLEVRAPAGYAIPLDHQPVSLRDQRSDLLGFEVTAPRDRRAGVDVLRIRLNSNKVALPVHKVEVQVPQQLRVGVLRGGDDALPSVLGVGGLGLAWSELTDADIAAADLRTFDTIVVDVRALRDRPAARRGFRRLLDFASGEGHRLVLFYQKDTEFHPSGEAFRGAPFEPFQVSKHRITRADAPIQVLLPNHPLLRHPNVIEPSDWDGWVQERALYVPRVYADDYEEILELHDPGQPSERGALLYARTGSGEYVYCALALWRQLKKLHPGAVRLLANLLTPLSKQ